VSDTASDIIAAQILREGGGGPNAKPTRERVPLFADLLAAAPTDAFFDFDAKHPGEVEAVAAFLSENGAGSRGSVKIDLEKVTDIERLLGLERRYGVMVMAKVILPRGGLDLVAALAARGVAAAEVWFDDLDQLAEACGIAGDRMAISTYTLDPVHCCGLSDSLAIDDPAAVWGRLIDAGVSVIMTDRPRALERFLGTL
jgi:glycerophosphoryl diester phosphodiesterase